MPYSGVNSGRYRNSAKDCVPVTKSNTLNVWGETFNSTAGPQSAARACDGLLVGTAGTATLVMVTGQVRTDVPLKEGYNPLQVIQVRNSGTAADIWALIV
jgi:hypothetical protein